MDVDVNNYRERMDKVIEALERNFTTVRAGRVSPSILDGIDISYYGVSTPLKSLATISIPEARQLLIKPYDKSVLGAIVKAIFEANIGVTPTNDGETIRIIIPPLTEERRLEFVKQVKVIAEESKISLRNIRHDLVNSIKKSDFAEDEEKKQMNRLQLLVDEYNKKIDEKFKQKEADLLKI